jgi:hypothetical protein
MEMTRSQIQKARSLAAASDRALADLQRIWPYPDIRVRKPDLMEGSVKGSWQPARGQSGSSALLRLTALAGVLIGSLVAVPHKCRDPLKGSAFFEGLVVVVVNPWLSSVIQSAAFTSGTIDWIVYGVAEVAAAPLFFVRFPSRNAC